MGKKQSKPRKKNRDDEPARPPRRAQMERGPEGAGRSEMTINPVGNVNGDAWRQNHYPILQY